MKVLSTIKNRAVQFGVGAVALVGSAAAMATTTTPSQGAAAISGLEAQVTELVGAAWPVAIAIVGGAVGIKLFKKFANKAT